MLSLPFEACSLPLEIFMAWCLKRYVIPVAMLACLIGACAVGAKEPIALSPEASRVVQDYLGKIGGRFGALVASTDGRRAIYHICQSRLWKNCDDYELNDRFVSVPSGRLAAEQAKARCGGSCVLLYMNEKEMRPYTTQ
jgi:hypothetical protein